MTIGIYEINMNDVVFAEYGAIDTMSSMSDAFRAVGLQKLKIQGYTSFPSI